MQGLKRTSDIKADCFTDKVKPSRFTQTGMMQTQKHNKRKRI